MRRGMVIGLRVAAAVLVLVGVVVLVAPLRSGPLDCGTALVPRTTITEESWRDPDALFRASCPDSAFARRAVTAGTWLAAGIALVTPRLVAHRRWSTVLRTAAVALLLAGFLLSTRSIDAEGLPCGTAALPFDDLSPEWDDGCRSPVMVRRVGVGAVVALSALAVVASFVVGRRSFSASVPVSSSADGG